MADKEHDDVPEMSNARNADRIAGLLEELRGLEARAAGEGSNSVSDRASAVKAQLKDLGVTVSKDGAAKLPKQVEKAVAAHNEPAVETAVNDGGK